VTEPIDSESAVDITSNRSSRFYRPFLDLIFPRICCLCLEVIEDARYESICEECVAAMPPATIRCLRCSAPVPKVPVAESETAPSKCIHCKSKRWSFRRAYCYTTYGGPCARAIKKMKRPAYEAVAIQLSHAMSGWMQGESSFHRNDYHWIVPVPQHWFRRLTIRYNQAETIAEVLSKSLEIPIAKNRLFRSRWTEKQGTKSLPERLKDVRNSFSCKLNSKLKGATILLVDDVVTSGATASDAARALRTAGVAHVDVAAIARAVGKRSDVQMTSTANGF
jgi:ComF family protein